WRAAEAARRTTRNGAELTAGRPTAGSTTAPDTPRPVALAGSPVSIRVKRCRSVIAPPQGRSSQRNDGRRSSRWFRSRGLSWDQWSGVAAGGPPDWIAGRPTEGGRQSAGVVGPKHLA